MKKKILCLMMAAILAVGAPLTAFARDYQGADGWQATFDGSKLNSNFKDEDVTDSMSEIQPGDSITLHVQLTNQDSSNTDWYMTNEVLQTLAKLRMTFAVEKVKEGKTIEKNTVIEKKVPQKNNLTTSRKAVKTGDTSNLLMYSVIGLVGGLIFLIAGIILLNNSRKTRQHREGEN